MEGGGTEAAVVGTVLAMIVTKTVDLVRNVVGSFGNADDPNNWIHYNWLKGIWNVLALGFGVGLAFVWNVNILDNFTRTGVQGGVGQFLTGLAIGGAASGWHELFDALSGGAKRMKGIAAETAPRADRLTGGPPPPR